MNAFFCEVILPLLATAMLLILVVILGSLAGEMLGFWIMPGHRI